MWRFRMTDVRTHHARGGWAGVVRGASAAAVLALSCGTGALAQEPAPGKEPMKAPELEGGVAWLNTAKPVTLAELKGKVVLLDFWTFG